MATVQPTPEGDVRSGLVAEVLGPVRMLVNGTAIDLGGPRQRRLLGILLADFGRVVSTDRLIDGVFEGEPSDAARDTFRTYVARLRRALGAAGIDGASVVVTTPPGYLIDASTLTLDSSAFEDGVRQGQERLTVGDADGAVLAVKSALAMWRGHAYSEFAAESWAQAEAVRLDQLRLAARELHAEAVMESGRTDAAIPEIEAMITQEPLREQPRRLLMVALYRSGRHAEALRCSHDFRRHLADETGLEPTAALVDLEQMIIERDPRLDAAPHGRNLRGYVLGEPIRTGPLGITHRAHQPSIGRDVAITVIAPEQADDPAFVRRFELHAQRVAAIEHPGVVPLYDYWREPGGAYLVTRYMGGGSLEDRLADPSPMAVDDIERIVGAVGAALTAAHGRGLVHGQLGAADVLLDDAGTAHLTGFGLSADARTTPGDIEALAGLARSMWDHTAPDGVESSPVAVRTAVESVLGRASETDPSLGYATAAEFVDAFALALHTGDGSAAGRGVRGGEAGSALPTTIEGPNPYRGLYPFAETDADVFFGRDALVDDLLSDLSKAPFLAVVGPSGSGKSSAVRAGLLPRFRAAGASVATMVPGTRPIAELEIALTRIAASTVPDLASTLGDDAGGLARTLRQILPDGPLVLVIDQFEEAFTLSDPGERDLLIDGLIHALDSGDGRLRLVVTARADFLGRILEHRTIGVRVRDHSRLVVPLSPEELHEAVVGPAEAAGVAVEPAVASALVADAAGAAGSLPLLQYALTELYEHRDDGTMTLDAYERLGRLSAVLTQRADEIYTALPADDQRATRHLFSRLIAPGEGTVDTRRRALRSELTTVPTSVVEVYGRARLLSFDRDPQTREPTVEVAHEALIREWPRLRSWIDDDREGLRILRHLTAAARDWEAADRDPGELYRGGRLVAADEWADDHGDELSPTELDFLDGSRRAREAEAERERKRVRRLGLLAASVGIVAVVAIVAGLLAFRERRTAESNAAEAERRALENRAAQLTSDAELVLGTGDPDLAILLALAAHDTSAEISETPQPGVVGMLHQTVQASRLERVIPAGSTQIAVHPDGRHVVLDGLDDRRRLLLHDLDTGQVVTERTLDDPNNGLAYSPDGSLLAVAFDRPVDSGGDVPAMLLLDPTTLETVQRLDGSVTTWLPSWSEDGQNVLAIGAFGETHMWQIDDADVVRTVAGEGTDMVVFVPGTNTIGILEAGTLDIVDRHTGEVLRSLMAPDSVGWMAFSPDGGAVAFADLPGRQVHVVDMGSDAPPRTFDDPSPRDMRFSPDGSLLSIAGNDDAVRVVDLSTGEILELRGHGTGSSEHAYDRSGDRLLVVTLDGSTRVWNLDPAGPRSLGNLAIGGTAVGAAGPVGDSTVLVPVATGSDEVHMATFDTETGEGRRITDFWFASFQWPVWSPDGSLVAGFATADGVATVVDAATGAEVLVLQPCETPKALDARNRWVLVDPACTDPSRDASASGARRGFVDLDSGALTDTLDEDEGFGAVLGPPGSIADDVLAYNTWNRVVLLRASTRAALAAWDVPTDVAPLALVFAPDGATLGLSAQTGQGFLFDVGAILGGEPAEEAVTVYEDMSTGPNEIVVPVGDRIVTSDGGTWIRQWDRSTGSHLADVPNGLGRFAQVFAMPDERTVYYQDADGVLRRLLTEVDDLVELARSRVQRGFSEAECERYFPTGECPA